MLTSLVRGSIWQVRAIFEGPLVTNPSHLASLRIICFVRNLGLGAHAPRRRIPNGQPSKIRRSCGDRIVSNSRHARGGFHLPIC